METVIFQFAHIFVRESISLQDFDMIMHHLIWDAQQVDNKICRIRENIINKIVA